MSQPPAGFRPRRPASEWSRETLEARSDAFDRVVLLALQWDQEEPLDPRLHALWTAINGVPYELTDQEKAYYRQAGRTKL